MFGTVLVIARLPLIGLFRFLISSLTHFNSSPYWFLLDFQGSNIYWERSILGFRFQSNTWTVCLELCCIFLAFHFLDCSNFKSRASLIQFSTESSPVVPPGLQHSSRTTFLDDNKKKFIKCEFGIVRSISRLPLLGLIRFLVWSLTNLILHQINNCLTYRAPGFI